MEPHGVAGQKVRVLCVDDGEDIPEMLARCIDAEPDMESAGCLRSADDLVAESRRRRVDVVLLDLRMPGKEPLEALRELMKAGQGAADGARPVRVIAFSGRSDHGAVESAMAAGAWGFVSKGAETGRILDAIREAGRGGVMGSAAVG